MAAAVLVRTIVGVAVIVSAPGLLRRRAFRPGIRPGLPVLRVARDALMARVVPAGMTPLVPLDAPARAGARG